MKSKKILVTGGAGFLGSHLCSKLIEQGNSVICVDNFFTGNKRNIKKLIENKNFQLITHDIIYPFFTKIDQIYNLACPASPPYYQKDSVKTIKTSIIGAINMLDLANKAKSTILQTSTSEIYGDPNIHPQIESYWGNVNPIGIRSCYDEGKRCAETLFFDYQRQYNTNIKVVRIFNTYGPNMDPADGRVVSNFIMQAINNKDITIYGNGNQTRSFCYVDDTINAIIAMMNSSNTIVGPINIGNPYEISIKELAHIIINLCDSKSKIIYKKIPEDDPKKRNPDISLAKKELAWEPTIDLITGLKETINYFYDNFIFGDDK